MDYIMRNVWAGKVLLILLLMTQVAFSDCQNEITKDYPTLDEAISAAKSIGLDKKYDVYSIQCNLWGENKCQLDYYVSC